MLVNFFEYLRSASQPHRIRKKGSRVQNLHALKLRDTHMCTHIAQSRNRRMWFLHLHSPIPVSSGPSFLSSSIDTTLSHSSGITSMWSRRVASKQVVFPSKRKEGEVCPLVSSLWSPCLSVLPEGVILQTHQPQQYWKQSIIFDCWFIAMLPLWGVGWTLSGCCMSGRVPRNGHCTYKSSSADMILCLSLLLLLTQCDIPTKGSSDQTGLLNAFTHVHWY